MAVTKETAPINLKSSIKTFLGSTLSVMFPARARRIRAQFTLPAVEAPPQRYRWTVVDSLIRRSIAHELTAKEQVHPGTLEQAHAAFWQSADAYYARNDRTRDHFIPNYGDTVVSLRDLVESMDIRQVVEFGCGDGNWLRWLRDNWSHPRDFTGIDLSTRQIARNLRQHPDLEFQCEDLVHWAREHARDHSLFHTNSGVLEYLSEQRVADLFAILRAAGEQVIVFLIEPLYGDFDPETDERSVVLGSEHSYSHNYPRLLAEAGFEVLRQEERLGSGHRNLLVVARSRRASDPGDVAAGS